MNSELQYKVEQFLFNKAELCDRQAWDEYLELFDEQCEFHIPQWDSEHQYTADPKREMSLIYYANRSGLEDRVYRIRTGKSAASTPMPRTQHQISNVRIRAGGADGELQVQANWSTLFYRFQASGHFYGYVTYQLKPHQDSWKITRKHIVLLNDTINAGLDFYHV
ncbi:anthranilate 1,2-dioxygenase small subunit [Neisseriaceae bacterium TC5R-5]|nr:anthranilate 1,2-dioxygenase small subunit [Neisseriaceae bacterium TC5R-5]